MIGTKSYSCPMQSPHCSVAGIRGDKIKATQLLRDPGQSIWLDNIVQRIGHFPHARGVPVNVDGSAPQLQDDGARSFVKLRNGLMGVISSKVAALDSMLKAVGNRPGASL